MLCLLTLYIRAQIALTKIRRALIVEERRLQLSCHARCVLIRIRLARAAFAVAVALRVATLEQARHIGNHHIATGTDSTTATTATATATAAAAAIAAIRLLVARALQHHHRFTVPQIRLIHQYGLAELMLQYTADNMEIRS